MESPHEGTMDGKQPLTFGRYVLERRIDAGGMAEVWKAKVLGPGGFEKPVAIKKVLPELASDSEAIAMFVDEAKLVAQLVHPNIVQVSDFGCHAGQYFIAMEYVAGTNLASLLREAAARGVRLPVGVSLHIALEATKGLRAAHEKTDARGQPLGIVHRDVSPQNVLVSFDGVVRVGDFGIAKFEDATVRTFEGQVRGKLPYMSPEQARGRKVDARSDLFSLGLVLYELLAGERLFCEGTSEEDLYRRVASFEGLAGSLAPIPELLRPLLGKLLRPDPADRFQDARAVESALGEWLSLDGSRLARESLAELVRQFFAEALFLETEAAPARAETPTPFDAPSFVDLPESSTGVWAATGERTARSFFPEAKRHSKWVATAVGFASIAVFATGAAITLPAPPAQPSPLLSPVAVATKPAAAAPTPKPALLSVTGRPWVEVWVDGRKIGGGTPVERHALSPGRHVLRFLNVSKGVLLERKVVVGEGDRLDLQVFGATGTIDGL